MTQISVTLESCSHSELSFVSCFTILHKMGNKIGDLGAEMFVFFCFYDGKRLISAVQSTKFKTRLELMRLRNSSSFQKSAEFKHDQNSLDQIMG